MCGLIGAFRTRKSSWGSAPVKNFMYQGLMLSVLRGNQGTGIGLVQDDGDVGVVKSHLSALDFIRGESFEWAHDRLTNSCAALGHTRYPTFQNTVQDKYAQPYMMTSTDGKRSVVLTHNGHLQNHYQLTTKIDKFTCAVDSGHLARAMAEDGADPLTFLPKVKGGYALVWYDEEKDLVYMANNGGRELFAAFSKDGQKVYYASQENTLSFLLEQNGIEYKEIVAVPKMLLCKFDLSAKSLNPGVYTGYKEEVFQSPVWSPARTENHTGGTSNYYRSEGSSGSGSGGTGQPKKGSIVWVRIKDANYTPYRDKKGDDLSYGHVWGTISTDLGSLVRVNGIKREDWEGDLKLLQASLPCLISTVEREDDGAGDKFNFYNCVPHGDKVIEELKRVKAAAKTGTAVVVSTADKLVPGPNDAKIPREEWDIVAREGCFECNKTIIPAHLGQVGWQLIQANLDGKDVYQMVCPPCVEQILAGKRDSKAL